MLVMGINTHLNSRGCCGESLLWRYYRRLERSRRSPLTINVILKQNRSQHQWSGDNRRGILVVSHGNKWEETLVTLSAHYVSATSMKTFRNFDCHPPPTREKEQELDCYIGGILCVWSLGHCPSEWHYLVIDEIYTLSAVWSALPP